jgi:hypothetical protein
MEPCEKQEKEAIKRRFFVAAMYRAGQTLHIPAAVKIASLVVISFSWDD